MTDVVERGVELTLEPAAGVPIGAPVPPEDDAAFAAQEPPTADCSAASGSGTVGQSFHSRSSE